MSIIGYTIVILAFIAILIIVIFKRKREDNKKLIVAENEEINEELSVDNKDMLVLEEIKELIIQDENGQQLLFERPKSEMGMTKYQEVLSEGTMIGGHMAQGALPVLGQAQTLAEIQKLAPNGLFTATADKAVLSHFADGTYTTMVRDSGNHLVANAGFQEVGQLNKINPAIAVGVGMQAMAMISGQYYMTQINSQLEGINKSLERLIDMHHDEKIGVLQNAQKRVAEITKRDAIDIADINEIRDIRNRIGEVYQEYETRLSREFKGTVDFKSDKWLVKNRVGGYSEVVDDLNFTLRVCAEADKLRLQTEVAEIAIRMKVDNKNPMIPELYSQLKSNYEDSLVKKLRDNPELIFEPIIETGEKVVGTGKDFGLIDRDKEKLMQMISDKSKETVDLYVASEDRSLVEKMIAENDEKAEIVMLIDDSGKQRVFIPVLQNDCV